MPLIGAIVDPFFLPAVRDIAAITNAFPALVTTTFDHNYLSGAKVRLYIPKNFGMEQANRLIGTIQVQGSTTFTISIDTSSFDAFVIPAIQPGFNLTPAQVVPVGEVAEQFDSSFVNILTPQG